MKYFFFFLFMTFASACHSQTFEVVNCYTVRVDGETIKIRGVNDLCLDQTTRKAIEVLLTATNWKIINRSNIGSGGRYADFVIGKEKSSLAKLLVTLGYTKTHTLTSFDGVFNSNNSKKPKVSRKDRATSNDKQIISGYISNKLKSSHPGISANVKRYQLMVSNAARKKNEGTGHTPSVYAIHFPRDSRQPETGKPETIYIIGKPEKKKEQFTDKHEKIKEQFSYSQYPSHPPPPPLVQKPEPRAFIKDRIAARKFSFDDAMAAMFEGAMFAGLIALITGIYSFLKKISGNKAVAAYKLENDSVKNKQDETKT